MCGYDLCAAGRDAEGKVRCPECGDPDAARALPAVSPAGLLVVGLVIEIMLFGCAMQLGGEPSEVAFVAWALMHGAAMMCFLEACHPVGGVPAFILTRVVAGAGLALSLLMLGFAVAEALRVLF